MKKYLAMGKVIVKEQFSKLTDLFGTIISFAIHIVVFSFLWDFVLEGKTLSGYTKQQLVWYVIIAETIMYSFHYFYRKVAHKVEMGDFAYDMTKPYNFLIRTISEGVAELPVTVIVLATGIVLGIIFVGALPTNIIQILICTVILLLASAIMLLINIFVGLLSIWLGRDVSSVWLLFQKAMLIFAFTPIELFPPWMQKILILLPTTHVVYTPSSLFVNFSYSKLVFSIVSIVCSLIAVGTILWLVYRKGVKKQNVNGV